MQDVATCSCRSALQLCVSACRDLLTACSAEQREAVYRLLPALLGKAANPVQALPTLEVHFYSDCHLQVVLSNHRLYHDALIQHPSDIPCNLRTTRSCFAMLHPGQFLLRYMAGCLHTHAVPSACLGCFNRVEGTLTTVGRQPAACSSTLLRISACACFCKINARLHLHC